MARLIVRPAGRLLRLWRQRPLVPRPAPPLKGMTDHPAYQWWRDATILQPHSWWGAAQTEVTLAAQGRLLRELGVRLFRLELPWRAIAPARPGGKRYDSLAARDPQWPGYRWERFDLIVRVAAEYGLALIPQVVFAPGWSTGHGAGEGGATAAPGAPEHVADVAAALAARYRGRVRHWELWNEPDHPHFWSGTLAEYVKCVLQPGAAALRAADPDCHVLLGGLADHRNLGAIYAVAGASALFDIVSVHVYPTRPWAGQVRAAMRETRATLRACGDVEKPVWLTECGISTRPPSSPSYFGGVTDEVGQARLLRALYRSVDAQAICYYQLCDTAIFDAGGQVLKDGYWGLVTRDLARRKPGFEAYRGARSPRDV